MISVLTLLPKLILTFKPFGKKIKFKLMMNFFKNIFNNNLNLFDIFFLIILIYYNVFNVF
jgi:hypothetical protein